MKSMAILSACLAFSAMAAAQSQTSDTSNSNPSWSSTSETSDSNVGSRSRTTESHTKTGNHTVDKQTTEIQRSGSYQPYQEIERETSQVDASTTRTTVRTYGRDGNGNRVLTQVTDEERHDQPDGGSKITRSTSNPDANGRLSVVQRQEENTAKLGKNVEETKTTTYLPGVDGRLVPSAQTQERREHLDDRTTKFEKTTSLSDGAGHWQLGERKNGTITDDGKNRTSEEHVARDNGSGNLSEVSRTVSRESRDGSGGTQSVVENYSKDVPGASSDGTMRLVERVTTSRDSSKSGSSMSQRTEQVNPGNPDAGLQVTVGSTGSELSASSGTNGSNTVTARDADGRMRVVSVDMTKSDKKPAVEVQIAPANSKPK